MPGRDDFHRLGLPEGERVTVRLVDEDGNAFSVLGRVSRALRRAGMPEKAQEYPDRATAGDYQHLLAVTLKYVTEPDGGDGAEGEDRACVASSVTSASYSGPTGSSPTGS